MHLRLFAAATFLLSASTPALAAKQRYAVMLGAKVIGHVDADVTADRALIDVNWKNNARGPTTHEEMDLDADGLPSRWTISGTSDIGSRVDERFARNGRGADWTDATGSGHVGAIAARTTYVAQEASPWALGLYARAILRSGGDSLAALPSGTLKLVKGETIAVKGDGGPLQVTRYDLGGIDTAPATILLDANGGFFAHLSTRFIFVRAGYEAEGERLRDLAAAWATDRFARIEKRVAHRYDRPVRIRNVHIFDPKSQARSAAMSVIVSGRRIAAVVPADEAPTPGEVLIDGAGGTLMPGMYEMHMHSGQETAFLNVLAGVTSVRDMGNYNDQLDLLKARIDAGTIGGPRITRAGFIEGRSQYSANNGIVASSETEAVEAVRWYAARNYWAIKSFTSVDPSWVPAMVREAHAHGMKILGHVPAFATADQMLAGGFDEMTHISQFMLQWVIKPGDDTRTLLRFTALKQFPSIDLASDRVQRSIALLAGRRIPLDITLGLHESLLLNRGGQISPGAADYFDHLPIGAQRALKSPWLAVASVADDRAYRAAYAKILETARLLVKRGVPILPGTDYEGSFTYHRELELYQEIGMAPAQILARATLDMARYLGQDQDLGSIEKGKLADFFLMPGDPTKRLKAIKTVTMVAKDGTFYFPAEAYPEFGIRPFAGLPKITPSSSN